MFDLEETFSALQIDSDQFWSTEDIDITLISLLHSNPRCIIEDDIWAKVLATACPPPGTKAENCKESVALITDGLRYWSAQSENLVLSEENMSQVEICREALEKYLFLTRMHLTRLDADAAEIQVVKGRVKFGVTGVQIKQLLAAVAHTVQTALCTLFLQTMAAKRASLALLYLEPTCKLLQYNSTVLDKDVVYEIIRVMCLGVKLQHQQQLVRMQMIQLLTYFNHAVPVIVEFLKTLLHEYDNTTLAEGVLRDLTQEASTWKDSQSTANITRAKTVEEFLVGLAEAMPTILVNNLSSIALLLASPFSKLRMGTIEVAPTIIKTILTPSGDSSDDYRGSKGEEDNALSLGLNTESPRRYKPAFELAKMIIPRVNDANHFVRAKSLLALSEICSEHSMISIRNEFASIAVAKMMDKSQYVRKQAMTFLKKLIDSHPQLMHPKNLSRKNWSKSLEEIDSLLETTQPESTTFQQLEAGKAFVQFTLEFIKHAEEGLHTAKILLNSRSKTDVLDAISLLVYGDAYSIEASEDGIRSIVHLVWAKADNDENNQVSQAAVDTYRDLFFTTPPNCSPQQAAQIIADNLIYLTINANNGTLTSLERLLVLSMERNIIDVIVVSRLWSIYQTNSDITIEKRRGAAIILSMLSLADSTIARTGTASLKHGLSKYAQNDYLFGAYTFTILKRSISSDASNQQRLPANYEIFNDIIETLVIPSPTDRSLSWNIMAKEALSAIVALCNTPSKVYTHLIQKYLKLIFGNEKEKYDDNTRTQLFIQLIYIVGEVALNLLVYCERCELEFKKASDKRPHSSQSNFDDDNGDKENDEEDLMAGGASPEDDFQDLMREFRENIIFYSDKALLKPFIGVVTDICKAELFVNSTHVDLSNNDKIASADILPDDYSYEFGEEYEIEEHYSEHSINRSVVEALNTVVQNAQPTPDAINDFIKNNNLLAICATQTLSKFMCVSSRFCEENLSLLVSLMTHHSSNVVRSNFVVALGDVAICFNRLIDEHTEFLYDRLNDSDETVQRTCIVALTFLILAGQIKVKGKLGEIAKTIVHPNDKINTLAKMFFNELSSKENAIYNSYIDILSTLIQDITLPEQKMGVIIKYLTHRLDKEKQMKKLTDKLVLRMKKAESEREWNAYVLAIVSMNRKVEDEEVKALIDKGFTPIPGQENEFSQHTSAYKGTHLDTIAEEDVEGDAVNIITGDENIIDDAMDIE